MRFSWRRLWFLIAIIFAILAVVVVHVVVDWLVREPPNYSQIEDGLWLGGNVAKPPLGSQAVLNLCEVEDSYTVEVPRWEPIRDAEPVPSLDWLRRQVTFIESERVAGRVVYVHCQNGASRSGMVLAAYLMWRKEWTSAQALEFLRSRRPVVRPNPAFMQLLLDWEQSLKK